MTKRTSENIEALPEANAAIIQAPPQILRASKRRNGRVLRYQIEVKSRGSHIAEYVVEATDALAAINFVERRYGEPAQVETVVVEDEHGIQRHVVVIKDWHGYSFNARVIGSTDIVGN